MLESYLIEASGILAYFNDGSTKDVPFELTLIHDKDNNTFSVLCDLTKRIIEVSPPTKSKLILVCNILLIDHWREQGRTGKPKKVEIE